MREQLLQQGYILREGWDDMIQRDMEVWYRFTEDHDLSHYAWFAREDHKNSAGFVHGGALATYMDHCMGSMCWLRTNGGFGWTMTLNMQFLKPARTNRWIFAEIRHLSGTGTNILLEGQLRSGSLSGPLLAQGQGSFTVPGRKAKKAVDSTPAL